MSTTNRTDGATVDFDFCQMCGNPEAPIYLEDRCKRCDAKHLAHNLTETQAAHEILEGALTNAIKLAHINPCDVRTLVEKVIEETRPYGMRETWQEMRDRMYREHADEDVTW
jgi:hypothetical protein